MEIITQLEVPVKEYRRKKRGTSTVISTQAKKTLPDFKIPYRIPEANIQAEFYHQCRLRQIKVFLQFPYEDCKFDCIVLDKSKKKILCVVEIKYRKTTKKNYNTKQMKKYRNFDVPVFLVTSKEDIVKTIIEIESIFHSKLR